MTRVVAVLGGHVFVTPGQPLTMSGQFHLAQDAVEHLRPFLADDIELVLSHGNGPQVGHILIRVEEAVGKAYDIPLDVCVAESEGELGYVLEQSLYNLMADKGVRRPIASLLTQVVVDKDDPAFANPSKPIGPFYDQDQADELRRRGFPVREDAGRGYRRVVPSPAPQEIVGARIIARLLEMGVLVIAAGGGGIPVVRGEHGLCGVEAVIDKDLTAALLADGLEAEWLIILTDVPCAYENFGTERQSPVGRISVTQAQRLVEEGHFASGSMRPKMEAAIRFASKSGRKVAICDLPSLGEALSNRAGTIIESD